MSRSRCSATTTATSFYLGERECSIQRRNQKIVEEAPSTLRLTRRLRRRDGRAGSRAGQGRRLRFSAGTVEFIARCQDKSISIFLEMNTRLQVEHPVTELVTGIDLVEQMIRVAAGEKLAITQADVKLDGWAIESRIYAEDPYRNFLPSIGRLVRYRPPEEESHAGITVRNDTGVVEGGEISMFYDPMVAKLITHAPDRATAIKAMGLALDQFVIDGIGHNIPLLSSLMKHPRWKSGALSTSFLADEYPDGFTPTQPTHADKVVLAAVALSMEVVRKDRLDRLTGRLRPHSGKLRRDWVVRLDKEYLAIELAEGYPDLPVEIDVTIEGQTFPVTSDWLPGDLLWRGRVGHEVVAVQVRAIENGWRLDWQGCSVKACVMLPGTARLDRLMPEKVPADTSRMLLCPMPGLVVSIHVEEGETVSAGQRLAIVEAMKMENVLVPSATQRFPPSRRRRATASRLMP